MSMKMSDFPTKMVDKRDKVYYEDALNETEWGKFNILMFSMCSMIVAAMVFELYSVSYVVPASACELNTTSEQQGLMAALPLFGVLLTSHLWGYLADKHGRRKMLCFSMLTGYVTGSLAAFSPNWIFLCVLKLFSSAAVSGAAALALTLLGECTPVKQRSTLLMLTTSVLMLCIGIMAVLTMPVLPLQFSYFIPGLSIYFNSWRLLNIIYTLPCAIAGVGAFCSCESPKFLLSVGKESKTMDSLRMIYAMNTGKAKEEYKVNSVVLGEDVVNSTGQGFIASIASQTIPMFKKPLLKDTLLLTVLYFVVFLCANPFIIWLPIMLNAFITSVENGATGLSICQMMKLAQNSTVNSINEPDTCSMNNTAMVLVLCMCVVLALGNIITGFTLKYVGKKRIYLIIQVIAGLSAFGINFSPIWSLTAVLFLVLMLETVNFGFLTSFAVDIYPTYLKATVVCLMLMVGRGSTILGVNVLKRLLDDNCEVAFYIYGILSMFAALVGLLLPPDRPFLKRIEP